MEEERRLCYVGMTRAERRLVLTCARTRRRFGGGPPEPTVPSRFIREIPRELIEILNDERSLPQLDLYSERREVRDTARKSTYTGTTYNSMEAISQFFASRGPVPPPPAPPASSAAGASGSGTAGVEGLRRKPLTSTGTQPLQFSGKGSAGMVPPGTKVAPGSQQAPPKAPLRSAPPQSASGTMSLPGITPQRSAPRAPASPQASVASSSGFKTRPGGKQKGPPLGSSVSHPKYGPGVLLRREGEGDDMKLTISFARHGLKKLVAKYAGITVEE
jgi:DNA helicase II / ATP-dependent DNA helicase PcrA